MPAIALFYGIAVRMYYDDHPPPHVHAYYGEHAARFDIRTGAVLDGGLPRTATRLVQNWLDLRQDALMANWDRMERGMPFERIEGLP